VPQTTGDVNLNLSALF